MENKIQMPTAVISVADFQNNVILNNDPDKTYKIVLKSKIDMEKKFQNIKESTNGIFTFQIPLTENGLSLVELPSSDVTVWGKMNEAPTRYNYHLYYSAQNDNQKNESIIKLMNIKVETLGSTLRILIQCHSRQNSFYLRIDSQGLCNVIVVKTNNNRGRNLASIK